MLASVNFRGEMQDAIMEKGVKESPTNTLWLFNIAMENGPLIDDFPIENLHL